MYTVRPCVCVRPFTGGAAFSQERVGSSGHLHEHGGPEEASHDGRHQSAGKEDHGQGDPGETTRMSIQVEKCLARETLWLFAPLPYLNHRRVISKSIRFTHKNYTP